MNSSKINDFKDFFNFYFSEWK